jgi:hypothetical protein
VALFQVLSQPLGFLWLLWGCATWEGGKDALGGVVRVGGILRDDGAEVGKILLAILVLGTITDVPAVAYALSGATGLGADDAGGPDAVAVVLGLPGRLVTAWACVAAAVTYRAAGGRRRRERRAA